MTDMKRCALILGALLTAGCKEAVLPADPVGRYQIVNGAGANLFIVDTRDGKLWRCGYPQKGGDTHCGRVADLHP